MAAENSGERLRLLGKISNPKLPYLDCGRVTQLSGALVFIGRIEKWHHIRTKLQFYNCVGSTAQYAVSSHTLESFGGLEAATVAVLRTVICQHPILGVGVVDEQSGQDARWARLESIDLHEVVYFKTISGGHQFILDEHHKWFDRIEDLPLWRVVIAEHRDQTAVSSSDEEPEKLPTVTTFDVGFFFLHAIGDGKSGVAFHLDFLDALNALKSLELPGTMRSDFVVKIPEISILPNIDATRWPLTIPYFAKIAFRHFILGDKDVKKWLGPPVTFSHESPPETCMRPIIVDPIATGKISHICRQNKATVTPLLAVLIARQLAIAYPTHQRFPAVIAMCLRRFTGLTDRQMGDHVTGVSVPYSTEDRPGYVSCNNVKWDSIRSCKTIIDDAISSSTNQVVGMMKFLGDYAGTLRSRKRENAFEVSNVGLVEGGVDTDKAFKFRRFIFSQSANVTESPYVFSVVSVKGGDMVIMLSWQKGILAEDKVKQVVEGLENDLYRLASGESLEKLADNR